MAKSKKALERRQKKKKARAEKARRARNVARINTNIRTGETTKQAVAAISDIDCPSGFRVVGHGQAMEEYGKPIFNEFKAQHGRRPETMEEFQAVLNLTMACWNYAIGVKDGEPRDVKKAEIEDATAELLPKISAPEFVTLMVERYRYLFPDEHDPKGTPYFVIRNEFTAPLEDIDETKWGVAESEHTPTDEEKTFLSALLRLDEMILKNADYGEYEKLAFSVEEVGSRLFEDWVDAKKLPACSVIGDVFCIFGTFIYQHDHDEATVTFKSVNADLFWEFFCDFILRKASMEPNELMKVPAILKLVGVYLKEVGYTVNKEDWIAAIDEEKDEFFSKVKTRYTSMLL